MNLRHIRSDDRFGMKEGWLDTKWHFSFGHYFDPENVQFGALRVFNDDVVAPASGFDTHPHREMEIVTVMLDGTLEHRDSTGARQLLKAGDVQRMSAGTGIAHSEKNPDTDREAKLFQIWVLPDTERLAPGYEQKRFDPANRIGRLVRVATRKPANGELTIHQDADFWLGTLRPGDRVPFESKPGRRQYLFVRSGGGSVKVDGTTLAAGDQARITGAERLEITAKGPENSELVLIDLA